MREATEITAQSGGRPLSRWAIVSVKAVTTTIEPDCTAQVERWASGLAALWKDGERVEEWDTLDRESWWRRLFACCWSTHLLWVFGHGMGRILNLAGIGELVCDGQLAIDQKFLVIDDPPFILKVKLVGSSKTLLFVDVQNYLRVGFSELESLVGSAEAVGRFVLGIVQVISSLGAGPMKPTAPSLAYSVWRHRYLTEPVPVHAHPEALELEREAYRGGRCQCFRRGPVPEKVYHLDYRAMYASLCAKTAVPVGLVGFLAECTVDDLLRILRDYRVIAEILIHSPVDSYLDHPGQPCRYRRGKFWTILCGPELVRALRRKHVVGVARCAWYRGSKLLGRYYRSLLRLRHQLEQSAEPGQALVIKMLCNSLIGKFGQLAMHWEDRPNYVDERMFGSWWVAQPTEKVPTHYRNIGGHVQREMQREEHPLSCPAIAAWVTSLGRAKLQTAIEAAGEHNCYYCDTDSLWTSETGYENLVQKAHVATGEYGRLTLVAVHDAATFYGPKNYLAGGHRVLSGLPLAAVRLPSGARRFLRRHRWAANLEKVRLGVETSDAVEWR